MAFVHHGAMIFRLSGTWGHAGFLQSPIRLLCRDSWLRSGSCALTSSETALQVKERCLGPRVSWQSLLQECLEQDHSLGEYRSCRSGHFPCTCQVCSTAFYMKHSDAVSTDGAARDPFWESP